jgi:hypothetical protein
MRCEAKVRPRPRLLGSAAQMRLQASILLRRPVAVSVSLFTASSMKTSCLFAAPFCAHTLDRTRDRAGTSCTNQAE